MQNLPAMVDADYIDNLCNGITRRHLPVSLTPNDQLCFVHVPKSGGISLEHMITERIPSGKILRVSTGEDLTSDDRNKYDFIVGHGEHGDYCKESTRDRIFLTMLRDPVDRVISFYRFIHANPDCHQYPLASQLTLEEFVHHRGSGWIEFSNFHARMLCNSCYKYSNPFSAQMARRVLLDQYTYIGITERFDESADLLSYAFNWPAFQNIARVNVTPKSIHVDIDPSTIQYIRNINAIDYMLYEEGIIRFESDYANMCRHITRHYFNSTRSDVSDEKDIRQQLERHSLEQRTTVIGPQTAASIVRVIDKARTDAHRNLDLLHTLEAEISQHRSISNRHQTIDAIEGNQANVGEISPIADGTPEFDKANFVIATLNAAKARRHKGLIGRIRKVIDRSRSMKAIKASRLFDAAWYLENYRDIAAVGIDPLRHFSEYGAFEGRNPSEGFNTVQYLAECPAAVQSGLNPLYHSLLQS